VGGAGFWCKNQQIIFSFFFYLKDLLLIEKSFQLKEKKAYFWGHWKKNGLPETVIL
jgi:hypothetical protein